MKPKSLLRWLALGVVATAAWLSRAGWSEPPAAPEPAPARPLQAVGTVHPRLAPDGKDIAFTYQGGIWRLPAEGGAMRRLTAGAGFAVEPCWSPDGKRLAFLQGRNWGGGLVMLIEADSGKAVPLPGAEEILGSGPLHFTPDGNRLVGILRGAKQVEALRSLDLQTGKLTLLQNLRSPRQPWALSADGLWLALVTTMDVADEQGGNDGPHTDVWKIASIGGEPERLVRFPARIHSLCWSADNKSLFVSTELGGVYNDIWRLDLRDPERPTKLTFGQADEDRPSVSRDGRWLLYSDNHAGCPALVLHDLRLNQGHAVPIARLDFGQPTGRVRLTFRDKASGQPLVVRVSLQHQDGGYHAAPGALWRIYGDLAYFHAREQAELDVPAGAYSLRAWHGPTYRMTRLDFTVPAGAVHEQSVVLDSWANPQEAGWYSGDNHIHANYGYGEYHSSPASMADMVAGEGLNVSNFMVANSDGDGVFDRHYFRGRTDPLSSKTNLLYWNEEFRSTIWGHLTLVNLKHVVEPIFTGFKDTTNPYDIPSLSAISEQTRRQGGLVNFTHPASRLDDLYRGAYSAKGLPVYAALGQIDTMDVMGVGGQASIALYHRLLNCGLRITASAGTDVFLNRTRSRLPGGDRVYVQIDGPLTYEKWIAGLKAGRSYVSNGPLVEFTVNDKPIGSVISLKGAGTLAVKASASSQFPFDRIEILHNGQVTAQATPAQGARTASLEQAIPVERSGWLALQVSGPAGDGGRIRAHTSPIYVDVAGKPAGAAEDARYFLQWIDRLWAALQERDRIPGDRRKAEIQAEVDQARKFYQNILNR